MQAIVLMGVSGCGKTTIGNLLAADGSWHFIEGDDLHPASNREKMASGTPLTDDDRWPWLEKIAAVMTERIGKGERIIVACSALKAKYRKVLRSAGDVLFIHLDGSKEVVAERLKSRKGHFMPSSLLDSQLATLEKPHHGISISINRPPEEIAAEIRKILEENPVV